MFDHDVAKRQKMCGNALTLGCSECGEKYETARGFAIHLGRAPRTVLRRTLRLCQWMKASREPGSFGVSRAGEAAYACGARRQPEE